MNAATCSCPAGMSRVAGWCPAASMRCMIVVPGSPVICRTPSRCSASMASCAPFTDLPPRRSAEHDVDRLQLGIAEQFVQALLPADPGQLHAAERDPGEVGGRAVDPQVP